MRSAQQQSFYSQQQAQQLAAAQQQLQLQQLQQLERSTLSHSTPPFQPAQQAALGHQLPMVAPIAQQAHGAQWAYVRPEAAQAWGSGYFPAVQQGVIQPAFAHHHIQQQQRIGYLRDNRPASFGVNGLAPQGHGGASNLGNIPWAPQREGNRQFGTASSSQESGRPSDGKRFHEGAPRGNSHNSGNSNSRNYDNQNTNTANWSRGGRGGVSPSPRHSGHRNEKGRGVDSARSQPVSLRCDSCNQTFKTSQQYNSHNSTHLKCDEAGCLFEGSGRVLKEHKQSAHGNPGSHIPPKRTSNSKLSAEELQLWVEERKRNYPTAANLKRKAEEMKARAARGELIDEDARKRRDRLKEILAKQADLGVPVAEVPSYYISDSYCKMQGRGESSRSGGGHQRYGKRGHNQRNGHDAAPKVDDKEPPAKVARTLDPLNESPETIKNTSSEKRVEKSKEILSSSQVIDSDVVANGQATSLGKTLENGKTSEKTCRFYERGWCKNGKNCEFLHQRNRKKKGAMAQPTPKKAPSLLSKLLESDIRIERSHLLQSFRFFVNNVFLLEYPEKPLEFSLWQERDSSKSHGEVGLLEKNLEKKKGDGDSDGDTEDISMSNVGQVSKFRLDEAETKGAVEDKVLFAPLEDKILLDAETEGISDDVNIKGHSVKFDRVYPDIRPFDGVKAEVLSGESKTQFPSHRGEAQVESSFMKTGSHSHDAGPDGYADKRETNGYSDKLEDRTEANGLQAKVPLGESGAEVHSEQAELEPYSDEFQAAHSDRADAGVHPKEIEADSHLANVEADVHANNVQSEGYLDEVNTEVHPEEVGAESQIDIIEAEGHSDDLLHLWLI